MSDQMTRTAWFLAIASASLVISCAPKTARMDEKAEDPTGSAGAIDAAPPTDLEAHRRQVEEDAQAFLNYRSNQVAPADATIEWNQPPAETRPAPPEEPVTVTATAAQPESNTTTDPVAVETVEITTESDGPEELRQSLIDFSRELYVSSTWSDMPLRELLVLASLSMLDPNRAIDPDAIPDLTDDERNLLRSMQKYFTSIGNDLDSESDAWVVMAAATEELKRRLNRTPDLELPSIALCTRVGGFGDFDEWGVINEQEQYSFIAHKSQPVIIYVEMEGFSSQLNTNDLWETITSQHLTIYSDRDGIPVWQEDWQSATDRSRKRRRDYFTVQKLALPRGLSVGRYHLKVRVRDERTEAEAELNIPFVMTAGVLE